MAHALGAISYLSFGTGRHVMENRAAILSALRYPSTRQKRVTVAVVTDRPEDWADLPVETLLVPAEQFQRWEADAKFIYARKIRALQHAVRTLGCRTALLDGDTYLLQDPARLVERIGPGRTVMHLQECRLGQLSNMAHQRLVEAIKLDPTFGLSDGKTLTLTPTDPVWNSGVVGCDPADEHWIEDICRMAAELYSRTSGHIAEQFSFGTIFGARTRLQPVNDLVFHYWMKPVRDPYLAKLPGLLEQIKGLPVEEQAERVWAIRPRWSVGERLKRRIRRKVLEPLKLRPPSIHCNL